MLFGGRGCCHDNVLIIHLQIDFEIRRVVDQMLAVDGRVVQNPSVFVRRDERIPICQVDLVAQITMRMVDVLGRDGQPVAHGQADAFSRGQGLRQENRQALAVQLVLRRCTVYIERFQREAVGNPVGFYDEQDLGERCSRPVGVADGFVHSQLTAGVIEKHMEGVLRACSIRRWW